MWTTQCLSSIYIYAHTHTSTSTSCKIPKNLGKCKDLLPFLPFWVYREEGKKGKQTTNSKRNHEVSWVASIISLHIMLIIFVVIPFSFYVVASSALSSAFLLSICNLSFVFHLFLSLVLFIIFFFLTFSLPFLLFLLLAVLPQPPLFLY